MNPEKKLARYSKLVPLQRIADVVSFHFDNKDWIETKSRDSKYVEPRKLFCYVARELSWDFKNLGRFLNLNHASVMHHVDSYIEDIINFREYQSKSQRVFDVFSIRANHQKTGSFPEDTKQALNISKREYFAAKAMQGYCGGEFTGQSGMLHEEIAIWSVRMADALLAELEKPTP